MELSDLEVYQLAREIGRDVWDVYDKLNWQDKRIIGNQCISTIDSIGANIAEGFGRYHYLDKNKFNYNSRGSLLEAIHWIGVLEERGKITIDRARCIREKLEKLHFKLNNYINSTKKQTHLT